MTMAAHVPWIREQVGKIKRDESNRRGAIFELVGTPLFTAPGSTVRPTPRNFKGYDATVTFPDDGVLDISMKKFGVSKNEREFLAAAKRLEKSWPDAIAKAGHNGLGLVAIADSPVSAADWSALQAQLSNLVVQGPRAGHIKVGGPWVVRVHSIPGEVYPIAPQPLSYQVMVSAPFHRNERQNLLDRLSSAATNARRFARGADETARALYIRLHEDADIVTYAAWAGELFRDEPDHPLDAVLLYQPAQVQAQQADGGSTFHLQHTLVAVHSPRFLTWKAASPSRKPELTLPIGTVSCTPSQRMIQHDWGLTPLLPGYFYQSGDFYSHRPFKDGTYAFRQFAPGLRHHFVLFDAAGGVTLSVITAPDGRFTLFD